jgi:hypothetical protein
VWSDGIAVAAPPFNQDLGRVFLEGCAAIEIEDRHQFVLASDVLGLSSLVDMLHSDPGLYLLFSETVPRLWCPASSRRRRHKRDFGGAVLLAGGAILRVCGRNPWHPSYLHYIVKADSFHTLVTEIISDDDPYLDQGNVFRLQDDLVMRYVESPSLTSPAEWR